jgi:hypothetical protein
MAISCLGRVPVVEVWVADLAVVLVVQCHSLRMATSSMLSGIYACFVYIVVPGLYGFNTIGYAWRPPVWYIWLARWSVGERESRGWWGRGHAAGQP